MAKSAVQFRTHRDKVLGNIALREAEAETVVVLFDGGRVSKIPTIGVEGTRLWKAQVALVAAQKRERQELAKAS